MAATVAVMVNGDNGDDDDDNSGGKEKNRRTGRVRKGKRREVKETGSWYYCNIASWDSPVRTQDAEGETSEERGEKSRV